MEYYQKALDIRISVFGENHPEVQNILDNIESLKQKIDKEL